MLEKAKSLLEDKSFVDSLNKVDSFDNLLDLFKENGVELSEAELTVLVSDQNNDNDSEELGEFSLEEVSGGGCLSIGIKALVCAYNKYKPTLPKPRLPKINPKRKR